MNVLEVRSMFCVTVSWSRVAGKFLAPQLHTLWPEKKNSWKRYMQWPTVYSRRPHTHTHKNCVYIFAINGVCDAVTWPINHKFNVLWNGIGHFTHKILRTLHPPFLMHVRTKISATAAHCWPNDKYGISFLWKRKMEKKNDSSCGCLVLMILLCRRIRRPHVHSQMHRIFIFANFCCFFYDSNCF